MRIGRKLSGAALASATLLFLAACPPNGGSGDLSGTYVAKDQNGTMTLEFKAGHKVHMTMQEGGNPAQASDGDYMINGNQVTVQVPGGFPIVLTRSGKTLDASMMGQIMHFEKQ